MLEPNKQDIISGAHGVASSVLETTPINQQSGLMWDVWASGIRRDIPAAVKLGNYQCQPLMGPHECWSALRERAGVCFIPPIASSEQLTGVLDRSRSGLHGSFYFSDNGPCRFLRMHSNNLTNNQIFSILLFILIFLPPTLSSLSIWRGLWIDREWKVSIIGLRFQ